MIKKRTQQQALEETMLSQRKTCKDWETSSTTRPSSYGDAVCMIKDPSSSNSVGIVWSSRFESTKHQCSSVTKFRIKFLGEYFPDALRVNDVDTVGPDHVDGGERLQDP